MEAVEPEIGAILGRAFPGCRVLGSSNLEGGVSARAAVAELVHGGEARRVVVRRPWHDTPEQAARAARHEYEVLARCKAWGIRSPEPLALDAQASAVVLAHLDGAPEFAPSDLAQLCGQMAVELANIHACGRVDELGFLERYAARANASITRAPETLDLTLDEPLVREALQRVWPWPQHNPDVLLHGDYWPGNLLWRGGELVAVIDWEECGIGDPLADVSVARLDLLWAFGEQAMWEFTRRYRERTILDWRNLPYWDLRTALRPMSNLPRWAAVYARPPIHRPDINEASMRAGHRRFVARAIAACTNVSTPTYL